MIIFMSAQVSMELHDQPYGLNLHFLLIKLGEIAKALG